MVWGEGPEWFTYLAKSGSKVAPLITNASEMPILNLPGYLTKQHPSYLHKNYYQRK